MIFKATKSEKSIILAPFKIILAKYKLKHAHQNEQNVKRIFILMSKYAIILEEGGVKVIWEKIIKIIQ